MIFAEPLFCPNSFENGTHDGSECANSAISLFQRHLHLHALFEVLQEGHLEALTELLSVETSLGLEIYMSCAIDF